MAFGPVVHRTFFIRSFYIGCFIQRSSFFIINNPPLQRGIILGVFRYFKLLKKAGLFFVNYRPLSNSLFLKTAQYTKLVLPHLGIGSN
jgi:hypothetical protein